MLQADALSGAALCGGVLRGGAGSATGPLAEAARIANHRPPAGRTAPLVPRRPRP
ncbi:hypothetical protein C7451_103242 [Blastomonas natatoria]|uniref:Uncharacterized protein n=1 Tax=Blastomonas natatoria TaxID=34015 RepID=A0A2V3VAH5_9SPHN|nr:hypothetical protein C7451_103242 [Blastomonas natatoria]